MKRLLAVLLCQVFLAAQCFAIDGGPFGGSGGIPVTGTYAGVLTPITVVLDPGPPEVTTTDNSLALFTLVQPKEGLAQGTASVFRNGSSYFGIIDGLADPDSGKLTGIITTIDLTFTATANGQFLHAKITPTTGGISASRIRGKAALTYVGATPETNSGGPIYYRIRGFKQSETATVVAAPSATPTATP